MAKKKAKPCISAKLEDGSPVVEVYKFDYEEEKNQLVMDCKALGSMRMDVIITPEDIAKGWVVVKENKKAIFAFAKKLPKAIKAYKKELKEKEQAAAQEEK